MVNLESQNLMQLSDFSVLNDIFHPSPAPSVDPRLVLTSRSPSWVPPSQLSPSKKEPTSSPAPVPLSVQELERADSRGPPPPSSPLRDEKSPPVDIVHLAAEEIRKPLLKLKDEPVKVFLYRAIFINLLPSFTLTNLPSCLSFLPGACQNLVIVQYLAPSVAQLSPCSADG